MQDNKQELIADSEQNQGSSTVLDKIIKYDGYVIHGSENSTDKDILYFIVDPNPFPTFQECSVFCRSVNIIENGKEIEENRNVALIRDGIIVKIYKGNEDEANNGLLKTYANHLKKQEFENPIKHHIERVVILKVVRACRAILTYFTKHKKYRPQIKETLRSNDFGHYLKILKEIVDISDSSFYELVNNKDMIKSFAFQLGQTLALIKGNELYTKNEIAEMFNELRPMLMREASNENTFKIIENYKNHLVDCLGFVKSFKVTNTTWNIFFSDTSHSSYNSEFLLCQQLKGVIIDMKPGVEFCKYFPSLNESLLDNSLIPIHVFEKSDDGQVDIWICTNYSNNQFQDNTKSILQQVVLDKQSLLSKFSIDKSFDSVFGLDISSHEIQVIGQRHSLTHKIVL